MTGTDVAKIARRHGQNNLLIVRTGAGKITTNIVDNLRYHARPVDRIDGTDLVFRLEVVIVRNRFDDILCIVKHAAHGDIEDVCILQREHLRSLESAHPVMRRQHKNAYTPFAAHRIFGRRTGISGGRTEDIDFLALLRQHVLEQIAEQLHGHVLKGQGRSIGEFEQTESRFEPAHRRDFARVLGIAPVTVHLGRIGLVDQRLQIAWRNIVNEF